MKTITLLKMTVESDFGVRRGEMFLPSDLGQTCHDMFMFCNVKSQNCTSFIFDTTVLDKINLFHPIF